MKAPGGETGRRTHRVPRDSGSVVLREALSHQANSAALLVQWLATELKVAPPNEMRGISGTICDIRPGFEETRPSMSWRDTSDGPVFHRFGADEFSGGAHALVMACLSLDKRAAAQRLIERAGLHDAPRPMNSAVQRVRPTTSPQAAIHSLPGSALSATELAQRVRGWQRLDPSHACEARDELQRRGLLPALDNGLLQAYVRADGRDVAFDIRGVDGQVWAVKVRQQDGEPHYRYLGKGSGAPAWCSPGLAQAPSELWIEGELNGVALALALQQQDVGVQGLAGAGGRPHLAHLEGDARTVYIYADPDEPGRRARDTWQRLAEGAACPVVQLPEALFGSISEVEMPDACDALASLGASGLAQLVMAAVEARNEPAPGSSDTIWVDGRSGYGVRDGRYVSLQRRIDRQGHVHVEEEALTQFTALITEELEIHDGESPPGRELVLEGRTVAGQLLSQGRRRVTSEEFTAMNWPTVLWGSRAIVHAGQGHKDRVRACIQLFSAQQGMRQRIVLTHTGWHLDAQRGPVYLTGDAVIGADGAVEGLEVRLDDRLQQLALPAPPTGEIERASVLASLALSDLAPAPVHVPALGALYRSPLGRLDTTVVLVGRTGFHKTAYLSLIMAHFGTAFHRSRLPSSWQSSANALEHLTFQAKDALLLIDDYKPGAGQPRQVGETFARIIQGVADGAGRATLTAERRARPNVYSRGTVMTSAEEFPEGHSNQARTLVVPVTEPLMGRQQQLNARYNVAEDQGRAGVLTQAMAGYVRFIAQHHEELKVGSVAHRAHIRAMAGVMRGAHGRNGMAAAELSYGWRAFLSYAVQRRILDLEDATARWDMALQSLRGVVAGQGEFLVTQDPVMRFLEVLSTLLTQRRVYLDDAEVGGPPPHAAFAGWQVVKTSDSQGVLTESVRVAPSAVRVGWVGESVGQLWAYLLPDAAYSAVQRACREQGAALPSQTALWANLRDRLYPAGFMRCDVEKRGGAQFVRPTRKTAVFDMSGHPRLLNLSFPLEELIQKLGNGGNPGNDEQEQASGTKELPFPPFSPLPEKVGMVGRELPIPGCPLAQDASPPLGEPQDGAA